MIYFTVFFSLVVFFLVGSADNCGTEELQNGKLEFSYKKPPKIIAEISGNHNGNKSRFLKLS